MRRRSNLTALALAVCLIPAVALAGDRQDETWNDQQTRHERTATMQQGRDFKPQLERADDLIGHAVVNRDGENLGEISDLVLDRRRNGVAYAALSYGGVLGMGEDLHAIPWDAFTVKATGTKTGDRGEGEVEIVLDATEKQLENAEGFDADHWPNDGNPRWTASVRESFYGEGRTRGATSADRTWSDERQRWTRQDREREMKSRRLSQLDGREVASPQSDAIGDVDALLVDVNRGRLAYVVVDVDDDALDIDGDRVAIPWHAAQVRGDRIFVDAQQSELANLTFEGDDLSRLEDRAYAMQMHQQAQLQPYWLVTVWTPENDRQGQQYGETGKVTENRDWVARNEGNLERRSDDGLGESTRRRYGSARREGQTVAIAGTVSRIERSGEDVTLHVKNDAGETFKIDAGRDGELRQISLAEGDEVAVMGERTHGKRTDLVATVISKGETVRIGTTTDRSRRDDGSRPERTPRDETGS